MYGPAISGLATSESSVVEPTLFLPEGVRLVHGLHKLAQQAIFLLLTEQGSIAGMPGLGVNLLSRLQSLSLSDTAAVTKEISQIVADLTLQLRAVTEGSPDDEQLQELDLELIRQSELDGLFVSLLLSSQAGDQAVYNTTLFVKEPV